MKIAHLAVRPLLCFAVVGSLTIACTAKPFVLEGDANSAQITYGGDLAAVTSVAKRHCAQFERVPRLQQVSEDVAYFDCVRP